VSHPMTIVSGFLAAGAGGTGCGPLVSGTWFVPYGRGRRPAFRRRRSRPGLLGFARSIQRP